LLVHELINDGELSLPSINPELLFRYVCEYDNIASVQGVDQSLIQGISVLDKSKLIELCEKLKVAADTAGAEVSNFDRSFLYDLIKKIEIESHSPVPRRQYIVVLLKIIRDALSFTAAIFSAVIAYLAYMKA
jgi:hypothetical protein